MSDFIGYFCVLIACIGFGSNYLPAKKVDIRDGQLFNVCLATGVFCVGLVQWAAFGFYTFEPFAMLGGALWGAGNLAVPLILACCGLGLGQLTWGLSQILTGWATGKFGLFGKEKDEVANPGLNYVGVGILLVSLCLFSLMRPPPEASESPEGQPCEPVSLDTVEEARKPQGSATLSDHLMASREMQPPTQASDSTYAPTGSRPSRGRGGRFFVGFTAAVAAGMLFGSNFNPPTYLQQIGRADQRAGRHPRHSPNDMDYVISHFSGIFLVTVIAFAVYKVMKPSTFVGRQVVLPGLAAGLMWGIAQVAWFKANGVLSYVVSFPIIVGVPGVIAALWGYSLFGENRGYRNGVLLVCIVVLQGVAVTLIALSKG